MTAIDGLGDVNSATIDDDTVLIEGQKKGVANLYFILAGNLCNVSYILLVFLLLLLLLLLLMLLLLLLLLLLFCYCCCYCCCCCCCCAGMNALGLIFVAVFIPKDAPKLT